MDSIDATNAEMRAYEFTVEAMICLERSFKDIAGARFRQGPRMRTVSGVTVTPDMTLEVAGGRGSAGYRAVGEIKSSFPLHKTAVDQMVRQVRHYDGELVGWEHEAPHGGGGGGGDDHDTIIVVRSKDAHVFATRIPAALMERGIDLENPLSILEIIRKENNDGVDQVVLKGSFGALSHKKAHDDLGKGWSIDARNLTSEVDKTKFYDSRPPLPYIMSVLWTRVFFNLVHGKKRKRLRMSAEVSIDVGVDRIHLIASKLGPSSNPGCVKRAWIKDAMEELVRVGLAEKLGGDKYRVYYSMRESQPLEWLAGLTASKTGSAGT